MTAVIITPVLMFVARGAFFTSILFRSIFLEVLSNIGSSPVSCAVALGMSIFIMAKSAKYSLFDGTKEMVVIPLDEEVKVKCKVIGEVVGGRSGKAGGEWI
jgi:ATP/ADP translocase